MANDFLPEKYEVPSSSDKYMKFQPGENRFRILSSPIIGWESWIDTPEGGRKPVRRPMDKPFNQEEVEDPTKIKHFWAMVVWNYGTEKVQVLEITQKGIQKTLRALTRDVDWGSPVQTYDIVITRSGEGMDTEYNLLPKPAKKLDEGILALYQDMQIDLTALYQGDDPFTPSAEKVAEEVAGKI